MALGRRAWSSAVAPSTLAREVGEVAAAGLLCPLGWTEWGSRAATRVLTAANTPTSGPRHRTPVLLVHGYGGSRCNWLPLAGTLTRAGFVNLHATTYNPFTTGLPRIARTLVAECAAAMEQAGTDRVHVVGHSLGGIVIRYAVQHLGLARRIGTAVTVATPHGGTRAARLGCGSVAASLLPGSPLLTDLRRRARADGVRWVAYYSDADLVVDPDSSRLDEPALDAENVLIPHVGHLGILRAPLFLDSVTELVLQDVRRPTTTVGPGPASRPRPSVAAA